MGQSEREEIDRQEAGSGGGENYGWDRLEGTRPFEGDAPPGAVPPVFDYGRERGGTVIGGYVYRRNRIPGLAGAYVFGDFFNSELQSLQFVGGKTHVRGLGVHVENLVSFGEDATGELYALSLSGRSSGSPRRPLRLRHRQDDTGPAADLGGGSILHVGVSDPTSCRCDDELR